MFTRLTKWHKGSLWKKQWSFYPPIKYILRKRYRNNRLTPTSYSCNQYGNESTSNGGYIDSVIPTRSTKYAPKFKDDSAHEHHLQNIRIPSGNYGSDDSKWYYKIYKNSLILLKMIQIQ